MSVPRKPKSPSVCAEEVFRNGGYWTGRFCGAPAKWTVGDRNVCGTHKNVILRKGWITEATPLSSCDCMTETDPLGGPDRVLTHSSSCPDATPESWTVFAPTPFGRHPISSHDTEAAALAAAAAENSTSNLRHFVRKDDS